MPNWLNHNSLICIYNRYGTEKIYGKRNFFGKSLGMQAESPNFASLEEINRTTTMENKERILQKAHQEAELIVQRANQEADELREVTMSKRVTYQEYIRGLARKGYKFNHEGDEWILSVTDSELKQLTDKLKENQKQQRKLSKRASLGTIKWNVNKGGWQKFHKCNDCENGVSFSVLKWKMAEMGISYMENALENAKHSYLKWGLKKSLDHFMELKVSIEEQMYILSQTPEFTQEYIELKTEEIKLRYNIDFRKQQAKEELRRQKDLEREEKKAQKEFEREIRKAKADEEEARKALERVELEAAKQQADKERFAKLQ